MSQPIASSAPSSSAITTPATPSKPLSAPDRVGWLEKRGKVRKNWTRRYFILRDNELKYYKSDKPNERSQGKIVLDGCSVEIAPESKYGRKFCFELTSPIQNRIFVIVAENGTSLHEWMNAIRRAMLRLRRERSKNEAAQRRRNRNNSENDGDSDYESISSSLAKNDPLSGASSPSHSRNPSGNQQTIASVALGTSPANSSGPNSSPPVSTGPLSSATTTPAIGASNSTPTTQIGEVPRSGSGSKKQKKSKDGDTDDKYGVYLQWLEETKDGRRKPSVKREDGSKLHHHLLDEEQNQKKLCGNCCCCIL